MRRKRKLRARAAAQAQAEALASLAEDRVESEEEAAAEAQAAEGGETAAEEGEREHEHENENVDQGEGAAEGAEVEAADAQEEVLGDADSDLEEVKGVSPARLKVIIESLLFAADKPLTVAQLKQLTGVRDGAAIQAAIDGLAEDYRERGIVLHDVAGGYQFRTHPSSSDYVQRLVAGKPVRLSRAQLETLAIIAYRQPVTRPEIDDIRGVDCGSTLKVLLDRDLIRVLGKKEEPGRPLLYGTTRHFLEFFNLRDLRELPTLREFHELTEESLREVEKLDQSGDEPGGGEPDGGGEDSGREDGGREDGGEAAGGDAAAEARGGDAAGGDAAAEARGGDAAGGDAAAEAQGGEAAGGDAAGGDAAGGDAAAEAQGGEAGGAGEPEEPGEGDAVAASA